MGEIKLIIESDEPALFFRSTEDAVNYIEAIDVDSGLYGLGYGPDGALFRISTHNGKVVIERDESGLRSPERLREILVRFSSQVGMHGLDHDDIDTMLNRCEKYISR